MHKARNRQRKKKGQGFIERKRNKGEHGNGVKLGNHQLSSLKRLFFTENITSNLPPRPLGTEVFQNRKIKSKCNVILNAVKNPGAEAVTFEMLHFVQHDRMIGLSDS